MSLTLDLQLASETDNTPDVRQISHWLETALSAAGHEAETEITVRLVDREESAELNTRFRGKQGATNVLSFPSTLPETLELPFLGDLVICAPLVCEEAQAQNKAVTAHWAHLCVHGCLHLLGYDHIEDNEAEQMEALETRILESLGYPNPY